MLLIGVKLVLGVLVGVLDYITKYGIGACLCKF
jgi:hypothetical protein